MREPVTLGADLWTARQASIELGLGNPAWSNLEVHMVTRTPPMSVKDSGKVRLGDLLSSFAIKTPPRSVNDAGKVRLGNLLSTFAPKRR